MKMISRFAGLVSALVLCGAAAHAADPVENWAKNCAACHGKDGAGHTKAGRMVHVKDMTDAQYQKSFTDEQAAKQIKGGLKDANGKEKMKAFGDVLTDADITALVGYIRSLRK